MMLTVFLAMAALPNLEIRECDEVEIPVAVTAVDGDAGEAYRSVKAVVRFDGARLQFTEAVTGAGVPGTLVSAVDADLDGTGAGTMHTITVTWQAAADTQAVGEIALLRFKANYLKSGESSIVTPLSFDSATVTDAAGATVLPAFGFDNPQLTIKKLRRVSLIALIRRLMR
jgi:hypothetical protein